MTLSTIEISITKVNNYIGQKTLKEAFFKNKLIHTNHQIGSSRWEQTGKQEYPNTKEKGKDMEVNHHDPHNPKLSKRNRTRNCTNQKKKK